MIKYCLWKPAKKGWTVIKQVLYKLITYTFLSTNSRKGWKIVKNKKYHDKPVRFFVPYSRENLYIGSWMVSCYFSALALPFKCSFPKCHRYIKISIVTQLFEVSIYVKFHIVSLDSFKPFYCSLALCYGALITHT